MHIADVLSMRLPDVAILLVVALLSKVVYDVVYNLYVSPLRAVPGPRLAAVSWWPIRRRRTEGKVFDWFMQLHREYGPVVRVQPDMVMFSDRDSVRQILVDEDLPKSDMVIMIRQKPSVATLFSFTDKAEHQRRRTLLAPAFSIRYLASLEPLMTACVEALTHKIADEIVHKDGVAKLNIYQLVHACTLDIIGETAFGGSFGIVHNGSHPFPGKVFEELRRRVMRATFPLFRRFFRSDPYCNNFVRGIVEERRGLNARGERRNDILQILMDARCPDTGKAFSESEIFDQAAEFLIAGTDTSAFTVGMALILLLRHKEKLDTLVAQLDAAFPVRPKSTFVPPHTTLKNLRYLDAVLRETMRHFPAALGGILRQARRSTVISGYHVPAGTFVYASINEVHHSKNLYGPDANEFRPERWLDTEYDKLPKRAFYGFSAGSRNCIASNFAWMEMRMILASILTNFDLRAVADQDLDIVHFITPSLRTKRFDVTVTTRR